MDPNTIPESLSWYRQGSSYFNTLIVARGIMEGNFECDLCKRKIKKSLEPLVRLLRNRRLITDLIQ